MAYATFQSRPEENSRSQPVLPSRVLGRLLDVLRAKFSNPANILRAELKNLLYSPDNNSTSIYIVPGFEAAPGSDQANLFPRIAVDAGDMRPLPDLSPVSDGALALGGGSDDGWLGLSRYISSFAGTAQITVASKSGMEALVIAEDVYLTLLFMKTDIRDHLTLSRFEVTLLKGPQTNEGPPSCLIAGVQIEWAASLTWDTVPDGLPLGDLGHPATN